MASHYKGVPAFRFPHMTEHDGADLWQGHPPDETLPSSFRLSLTRNWQPAQEARFEMQATQTPLAHAISNRKALQSMLAQEGHDDERRVELERRIQALDDEIAGYEAKRESCQELIGTEDVTYWTFDLEDF